MIRVISNSEKLRFSAYHLVKAFLPDEEVIQENGTDASEHVSLNIEDACGKRIVSISGKEISKAEADLTVYDMFKDYTGRDLPWGVLTGVRPVKLASEALDRMSKEEFLEEGLKKRRVSRAKASLSWDIAVNERNSMQRAGCRGDLSSYSLYVGIPICPSICSYCSFSSGTLSVWKGRLDEYVDSLCAELENCAHLVLDWNLVSIYIGGGTPCVLNTAQQARLLECINRNYPVSGSVEYTLEAGRPDVITREKLVCAMDFGVNRLSINPQTMQQKTLDRVNRRHSVEQVEESYILARSLGYENINMDIIAGLPGEDAGDMEDTLKKIEKLAPDSLTVHALAIKRAAKMNHQYVQEDTVDEMIGLARESAFQMGMVPYYLYRQKSIAGNHENCGYALPGKECIYNMITIGDSQSVLAAGAGSTTKLLLGRKVQNPDRAEGVMTSLLRQDNLSEIGEYMKRVGEMVQAKEKLFDNAK